MRKAIDDFIKYVSQQTCLDLTGDGVQLVPTPLALMAKKLLEEEDEIQKRKN